MGLKKTSKILLVVDRVHQVAKMTAVMVAQGHASLHLPHLPAVDVPLAALRHARAPHNLHVMGIAQVRVVAIVQQDVLAIVPRHAKKIAQEVVIRAAKMVAPENVEDHHVLAYVPIHVTEVFVMVVAADHVRQTVRELV